MNYIGPSHDRHLDPPELDEDENTLEMVLDYSEPELAQLLQEVDFVSDHKQVGLRLLQIIENARQKKSRGGR